MDTTKSLENMAADVLARHKDEHEPTLAQHVDDVDAVASHMPNHNPVSAAGLETFQQTSSILKQTDAPDVVEDVPIAPSMQPKVGATAEVIDTEYELVEAPDDVIITSSNATASGEMTDDDFTMILSDTATEKMSKMPDDARANFLKDAMPEIETYRKTLIIENGLTPAEATEAAKNRISKQADAANASYANANPDAVIVTIDKSQSDEVVFSPEEESKIQRARAIKLVEVQAEELKMIKVKPIDKVVKMSAIRKICNSMSQYSIPLLSYGDYATFYGAQAGVLASCVSGEDDTALDALDKKATLLYKYFGGGQGFNLEITDEKTNNTRKMSYEEFCNAYHYDDIDMGIYAIVTASSMEVTETTYPCRNPQCNKPFQVSYNQKSVLDLSTIGEEYQERLRFLDDNRSSLAAMESAHKEYGTNVRMKSPFSKNIYEFGSPSIAQARASLEACLADVDVATAYDMVMVMYLTNIWVYDEDEDGYLELNVGEDPKTAFDVICHLHQIDLDILFKYIRDHKYNASFKIKTKCPHCGRTSVDTLSVDNMVFLHARASLTEIQ